MSKAIKFNEDEVEILILKYRQELMDTLEHAEYLTSVLERLGDNPHDIFPAAGEGKKKKKKKDKKKHEKE